LHHDAKRERGKVEAGPREESFELLKEQKERSVPV
jgi:hypothetical protein